MNRPLLWFTTAMFGAATLLMTTLGLLAVLLFLLLFVPFVVRGSRSGALSGEVVLVMGQRGTRRKQRTPRYQDK